MDYTTVYMHPTLTRALDGLLARAIHAYPGEERRIRAGYMLARNGHVSTLPGVGSYQVIGSALNTAYVVLPKSGCSCPDARSKAPERRCKHRWAVALVKKACAELLPKYYEFAGEALGNNSVTLGNRSVADEQREKDGSLAAKVCGY